MERLKKQINELAYEEMEQGINKHGIFNSYHEGYAVMLEEYEEMQADLNGLKTSMQTLWVAIKTDNETIARENIEQSKKKLGYALAEGVQCLAMLKKMQVK